MVRAHFGVPRKTRKQGLVIGRARHGRNIPETFSLNRVVGTTNLVLHEIDETHRGRKTGEIKREILLRGGKGHAIDLLHAKSVHELDFHNTTRSPVQRQDHARPQRSTRSNEHFRFIGSAVIITVLKITPADRTKRKFTGIRHARHSAISRGARLRCRDSAAIRRDRGAVITAHHRTPRKCRDESLVIGSARNNGNIRQSVYIDGHKPNCSRRPTQSIVYHHADILDGGRVKTSHARQIHQCLCYLKKLQRPRQALQDQGHFFLISTGSANELHFYLGSTGCTNP